MLLTYHVDFLRYGVFELPQCTKNLLHLETAQYLQYVNFIACHFYCLFTFYDCFVY